MVSARQRTRLFTLTRMAPVFKFGRASEAEFFVRFREAILGPVLVSGGGGGRDGVRGMGDTSLTTQPLNWVRTFSFLFLFVLFLLGWASHFSASTAVVKFFGSQLGMYTTSTARFFVKPGNVFTHTRTANRMRVNRRVYTPAYARTLRDSPWHKQNHQTRSTATPPPCFRGIVLEGV